MITVNRNVSVQTRASVLKARASESDSIMSSNTDSRKEAIYFGGSIIISERICAAVFKRYFYKLDSQSLLSSRYFSLFLSCQACSLVATLIIQLSPAERVYTVTISLSTRNKDIIERVEYNGNNNSFRCKYLQ